MRDRNLAFGCILSFILGIGLFGSVYLLPLFLAFVHGMGPLQIGLVILVTGIAQLVTAPVAVQVDRYVDARLLSAVGFGAFAIGLLMSGFQTIATGYDEMFWPQVVRGAFVALCILPPIRFALGFIPREHIADASAPFNLSRNLGGAIGIALIDTIVFSRGPEHADRIIDLIKLDPAKAAAALGLTVDALPDPLDPLGLMGIMDIVQQASITSAINEAWIVMGVITATALVVLLAMGPILRTCDASKWPAEKLRKYSSSSIDGNAAIDQDRRTGYEARRIRREVKHRSRDFLGLAMRLRACRPSTKANTSCVAPGALVMLAGVSVPPGRIRSPGCPSARMAAEGLAQADQSSLTGSIGGHAGHADGVTHEGACENERTAAALDHRRHLILGTEESTGQVGVERVAPSSQRHLRDWFPFRRPIRRC